jgi:hypothetical protein
MPRPRPARRTSPHPAQPKTWFKGDITVRWYGADNWSFETHDNVPTDQGTND